MPEHKCIDELRRTAKSIGASLDTGGGYCLILDAPAGYVWSCNDASSIVWTCATNSETWYAQACKDAVTDARMGLHKCNAEQAAEIEYDRDEPWTAPDGSPDRIDWPN